MKQKISLIQLTLVFLISIVFLSWCTKKIDSTNTHNDQFEFYWTDNYWTIIDTKNNVYVKDMVCNTDKKYNLNLSKDEKDEIYKSVLENNLMDIKDDFTKNCNDSDSCMMTSDNYNITVTFNVYNKTKTIKWGVNYIETNDPELKRLSNVIQTISTIIANKEQKMNIEQPQCGYI